MAIIRLLIENGADANRADRDGWTPFQAACDMNHVAAARFLLEQGGVDVSGASPKDGDTPLHRACMSGRLAVAKMLLEEGADAHVENVDGDLPARIAQRYGFPDIARMLAGDGPKN